jgi:hypothetical protein
MAPHTRNKKEEQIPEKEFLERCNPRKKTSNDATK